MKTPICDFVSEYKKKNSLRLHMPGHKGKTLLGFEGLDITEIDGADVLYSPKGIIAESEENARSLFESEKTLYSTEGSSLAIRAMLYLASLWGESEGRDRTVFAGRNAHRVFHSGVALLDLDVEWLYGDDEGLMSCNITAEYLEKVLSDSNKRPFAVYLTSPDYLGNILDIGELSAVCRKHGTLCIVDNAHGAYLHFLPYPMHPMDLGAHMCADSAHKTLPALTGAAYLHIGKDAPDLLIEQAEKAMSLFASTSPSYLILQSLDAVNKYIAEGYSQKIFDFLPEVEALCDNLISAGYTLIGDEPLKVTLSTKPYGYLGTEVAEYMREQGIVCEHADRDVVVLMLTPEVSDREMEKLEKCLCRLPKRPPVCETAPAVTKGERVMSVRKALLSGRETIPTEQAVGRILADCAVSCPPAVPIAVCGEIITKENADAMRYYGIETVTVV